jgi:hypothetical protein
MKTSLSTLLFAACLALPGSVAGARSLEVEDETLRQAWALAAAYQFNEALALARRSSPSDQSRFAEAILLLNRQPRTAGNVQQAEKLLTEIAKGSSALAAEAAFYHARVPDLHQLNRNPALARERYLKVHERWPDDAFGQAAWVRAALIEATEAARKPELLPGLLSRLEREGERMSFPASRRDYHLLMADLYERFEPDAGAAARHLDAALEAGIPTRVIRTEALVKAGSFALRAGDCESALRHWRAFLATAPGDPRASMIRKQVEQAGATAETASF